MVVMGGIGLTIPGCFAHALAQQVSKEPSSPLGGQAGTRSVERVVLQRKVSLQAANARSFANGVSESGGRVRDEDFYMALQAQDSLGKGVIIL